MITNTSHIFNFKTLAPLSSQKGASVIETTLGLTVITLLVILVIKTIPLYLAYNHSYYFSDELAACYQSTYSKAQCNNAFRFKIGSIFKNVGLKNFQIQISHHSSPRIDFLIKLDPFENSFRSNGINLKWTVNSQLPFVK